MRSVRGRVALRFGAFLFGGVKRVAGEQIKGESPLAYEYFKIFRDLPHAKRNLNALCVYEVFGKKRTQTVFARWHKKHDWANRVNLWDIERSRDALRAFITRRNKDLEKFIDDDFTITRSAQQIVIKVVLKLSKEKNPSATEFRTLMLGYAPVRTALKDLIGIFDKEVEDANAAQN